MEQDALATPDQAHIYRDLAELIGTGIADLYYDACAIRNGVTRLRAGALQIGHLFREVDSAVRAVLTPTDWKKPKSGRIHAANVKAVRDVLGLKDDDRRVLLWEKFSDENDPWHLMNYAHRNALGGVRAITDDFRALCADFDVLLVFVLDRIRTIANTLAHKLNEILAISAPTSDDVKTLRNNVPSAPFIFDRLFDEQRLTDAWIDALLDDGFFADPPPGSAVIAAMFAMHRAEADPARARAILEALPSIDDVFMANAYIVTIQKLPAGAYGNLFAKVLAWIESPGFAESGAHLYIEFGRLVKHLGSCDDAARVIELTAALTVLSEPKDDSQRFIRNPDSLLDAEEFDALFSAAVDALYVRDPLQIISLLSERLKTSLAIEFPDTPSRPSGDEDVSEAWVTIFDDPTEHAYSIKQVLARRLSDALVRAYDADPTKLDALISTLRARRFRVFRRLEAHLFLHAGDAAATLADAMVTNPQNFWSYSPPLEFAELLRARYPRLDEQQRTRVLDAISAGLDPASVSDELTPDDLFDLGEHRAKNYLSLLTGHLSSELETRLADLIEKHGPSTQLAATVHTPAYAVGYDSPWTDEQISSFSPDEFARNLYALPYAYGSSEQLRRAISDGAARFSETLVPFEGMVPEYLRSVIQGFSLALRERKPFAWQPVLAFADRILRRADARDAADPNAEAWSRVRYEISTLINDGTSQQFPQFDRAQRTTLLAIIGRILDDETPSTIQHSAVVDTALSRSLVDTRTAALRALINVTFRFHAVDPTVAFADRDGIRAQPDALALLGRFLAAPDEPVHVLFGERFDLLCQLDATWAQSAVPHVFPLDRGPTPSALAAWEAYVTLSHAKFYCHDLLREQYSLAARTWPLRETRTSNPDFSYPMHLATHVLVLYVHGRLSLEGDVASLYERIADESAGRAMFRLVPYIAGTPAFNDEQTTRLIAFWEWRMAQMALAPERHQDELRSFGAWFNVMKLPEAWALEQLVSVLALTGGAVSNGSSHTILKSLRTVTDAGLPRALDCVEALVHAASATSHIYWWNEDIQALLLRAWAVGGDMAQAARALAGRLTSMRIGGYDDLLI